MANTELENDIDLSLAKASTLNVYADNILGDIPIDELNGVNINLTVSRVAKFDVEGNTFIIDESKIGKLYSEVEYIEGKGKPWIDTNIHPKSNITIRIKFLVTNAVGSVIIGVQDSESKSFRFFNANYKCYLDYGSGEGYNRIFGSTCDNAIIYNFEIGNRYVKNIDTDTILINGTTVSSFEYDDLSIGIFSNAGNADVASGKIYYVQILEGDTLVRDMIPVIRESDGVVCMYDKVSKTFFENSGAGDFDAGPEI